MRYEIRVIKNIEKRLVGGDGMLFDFCDGNLTDSFKKSLEYIKEKILSVKLDFGDYSYLQPPKHFFDVFSEEPSSKGLKKIIYYVDKSIL